MKRTGAQKERQRARNRKDGRYASFNPCEVCGLSAGVDYLSHPRCNELGYGLVLCHRQACHEALERRIKEVGD